MAGCGTRSIGGGEHLIMLHGTGQTDRRIMWRVEEDENRVPGKPPRDQNRDSSRPLLGASDV